VRSTCRHGHLLLHGLLVTTELFTVLHIKVLLYTTYGEGRKVDNCTVHLCVGEIPGPLLFGWAIDHSCLLWEQKCDGSTGACLYYDNHQMGWLLLALCAACKVLTVIFSLLGWRIHVYKQRKGDTTETKVELDTPTVPETGNRCTSAEDIVEEAHGDQEFATSNPAFDADSKDF